MTIRPWSPPRAEEIRLGAEVTTYVNTDDLPGEYGPDRRPQPVDDRAIGTAATRAGEVFPPAA